MVNQENFQPPKSPQPLIHRGPWIMAGLTFRAQEIHQKIIEDGALLVADGLIQAVGKYKNIAKEFGHYHTQDHEGRVLVPALINSHCHLELSHIHLAQCNSEQNKYGGDITVWIRDFLAEREKFSQKTVEAEELILSHARQTLEQMSVTGIAFVGDVGNALASRVIGDNQSARVSFLLELLGLTKESEAKTIARLESITANKSFDIGCTAHAPYSTTPAVIKAIKKAAEQKGHIFSIHVAESSQEIEFLQTGTGSIRDFLLERDGWDNSFVIPEKGSVQYLEKLGVLDNKTLCVHGVHVNNGEVEILAQKKAKVCLCPGSNRFLGVGKAPVTDFLAHGILPALGTDSLASNSTLSMWREMRLLREDHPGLTPESVFAMATLGGAEAWGVDSEMGSLEPGKRALALAISCQDKMQKAKDVLEYLTAAGESVQGEWLE
jgi:cytosine/adenosine deaminase-related metal-dependent hydrolase